jgi:hypothetical protein
MALPKTVVKARLPWILGMFSALALGALLRPLGGLGLMIAAEVGFFALFFSRIQHVGWDKLKRDLRAKLALPETLPVSLVCYVTRTSWERRRASSFRSGRCSRPERGGSS